MSKKWKNITSFYYFNKNFNVLPLIQLLRVVITLIEYKIIYKNIFLHYLNTYL